MAEDLLSVADTTAGRVKTATIATAATLIDTAISTPSGYPLNLRVHGRR